MKDYSPNECSPARPAIIRLPDTPVPLSAFGPANVQWTTVRGWFCLSVAVFASVFASLRVSLTVAVSVFLGLSRLVIGPTRCVTRVCAWVSLLAVRLTVCLPSSLLADLTAFPPEFLPARLPSH